jgi:hypothetical protein
MAAATPEQRDEYLWLRLQRSSFNWPKEWRAVVFKIDRHVDVCNADYAYVVYPRNPEYDIYMQRCYDDGFLLNSTEPIPAMHLGAVKFATLQEVDAWARVAARISK